MYSKLGNLIWKEMKIQGITQSALVTYRRYTWFTSFRGP